ncbi:MAG: PAS domain S-box protein [Cyanobacteria bacterium REEB65]|nr:PAS domain S-box protein [Cyanobacteria bacterium REEB65]
MPTKDLRQLSEALVRGLLEGAPDAMIVVDAAGRIQYANSQAERIFGYSRPELQGAEVEMLLPTRFRDVHVRHRADFHAHPHTRPMGIGLELFGLTKAGREFPVEISLSPFPTPTGMLTTAAVRDISDRIALLAALKHSQAELQRLNAELEVRVRLRTQDLETANQELEAFSYSVSHDLRAPLRSLSGFSAALLEDYGQALDETGKDYLRRIQGAADRLALLIDGLLALSRLSRVDLEKVPVDLSRLARASLRRLREAEPDRQVEATVEPGLVAPGDPRLLEAVIENLLQNAWKFSAGRQLAHIAVGREVRDDKTIFFVRDDGAGFDPSYADKLFAPFQRLHSTAEFPGLGLGLALVKRIIRRHRGDIWATSALGQGTTVFFRLGD